MFCEVLTFNRSALYIQTTLDSFVPIDERCRLKLTTPPLLTYVLFSFATSERNVLTVGTRTGTEGSEREVRQVSSQKISGKKQEGEGKPRQDDIEPGAQSRAATNEQ